MICPKCKGSGQILDQKEVGLAMAFLRVSANVGLREIARRLNYSPTYIHRLEHGLGYWNEGLVERYKEALCK